MTKDASLDLADSFVGSFMMSPFGSIGVAMAFASRYNRERRKIGEHERQRENRVNTQTEGTLVALTWA